MRPSVMLLFAFAAAACTPRAVTPPTRTVVMSSPLGPPPGATDAQVDLGKVGQLFGPELTTGNGRVRQAVAPNVVLEGDAGILHVTNGGQTPGPNRTAYTGRLGVMMQTPDHRWGLIAGAGGGTSPTAGNWAGFDVGAMVSGQHQYIRPFLVADFGYGGPVGRLKQFAVPDDGETVMLRLPRNFIGKLNAGIELGRPEFSILLGITMVKFWLRESSLVNQVDDDLDREEGFAGVAIGIRARL